MNFIRTLCVLLLLSYTASAQKLRLPKPGKGAMTGTEFIKLISNPRFEKIEPVELIATYIAEGNVPSKMRKLVEVRDSIVVDQKTIVISYWVLPDYLAVGTDEDYFYCPMTPNLAQLIANLTRMSLPTRKMVDNIYRNATIKLDPRPIPPSPAMTTVPIFAEHNRIVRAQLEPFVNSGGSRCSSSRLIAGNKKDIVISNKIYGEPTPRVVIYGWHKLDGKPIQPLYNKHMNTWVDYSHGVRLIENRVKINGKSSTIGRVLKDPILSALLSDEGVIATPRYPVL